MKHSEYIAALRAGKEPFPKKMPPPEPEAETKPKRRRKKSDDDES